MDISEQQSVCGDETVQVFVDCRKDDGETLWSSDLAWSLWLCNSGVGHVQRPAFVRQTKTEDHHLDIAIKQ